MLSIDLIGKYTDFSGAGRMKNEYAKNEQLFNQVAVSLAHIEDDFRIVNKGYSSIKTEDITKFNLTEEERKNWINCFWVMIISILPSMKIPFSFAYIQDFAQVED